MTQEMRQELLLSLLKTLQGLPLDDRKRIANDIYLSASELDMLLTELIAERSRGKKRSV